MEIFVEVVGGDLQAALDTVAAAGGGTVFLRPGRHLAGPIRLSDNVTLHIEENAVLAFAPDYKQYGSNTVSVLAEASNRAYIVAQNARNIALAGKGTIDAAAMPFTPVSTRVWAHSLRSPNVRESWSWRIVRTFVWKTSR